MSDEVRSAADRYFVRQRRRGLTMLEAVIASAMLATMMAAIGVIMRSGRLAWESHQADYVRIESAHAMLRHIVRRIRQADSVTSISPATDPSGSLTIAMPNGDRETWDHDEGTDTVKYGVNVTGTPTDLLAAQITGLTLTGFRADGATQTSLPDEVQCLRVEVAFELPREVGGSRVVRSWAWMRAW